MITVKLMGGMGNQMFQYAFGAACAARLNTQIELDPSMLGGERPFNLGQWSMYLSLANKPTNVFELGMGYNQKLVDSIKDGDVLQGYWQSEKYFAKLIPDALRQVFVPFAPLPDIPGMPPIGENSVAVHVRRGDYLKEPHKSFHGNLDSSYYGPAIDVIEQAVDYPQYFIFTDDPEWVREKWCTELSVNQEFVMPIISEAHTLHLMGLMQHAIIANSSFSWWGAWLGDEKTDRVVIAPEKWFANMGGDNYSDIVPERWLKI